MRTTSTFGAFFFGLGCLLATVAEGFMLGTLLGGLPLSEGRFGGGPWTWLSPFSLLAVLSVLGAYGLCGACWLIMKTEGVLQEKAFRAARSAAFFLLLALPALVFWTRGLQPVFGAKWLSWPGFLYSSLPLALSALSFAGLVICLSARREAASFILAAMLVLLTAGGLAGSWYPMLVPPDLSVFQASSSSISLEFMLFGVGIFLPLMLAYNAYQYWVFKGKVQ